MELLYLGRNWKNEMLYVRECGKPAAWQPPGGSASRHSSTTLQQVFERESKAPTAFHRLFSRTWAPFCGRRFLCTVLCTLQNEYGTSAVSGGLITQNNTCQHVSVHQGKYVCGFIHKFYNTACGRTAVSHSLWITSGAWPPCGGEGARRQPVLATLLPSPSSSPGSQAQGRVVSWQFPGAQQCCLYPYITPLCDTLCGNVIIDIMAAKYVLNLYTPLLSLSLA